MYLMCHQCRAVLHPKVAACSGCQAGCELRGCRWVVRPFSAQLQRRCEEEGLQPESRLVHGEGARS